MGMSSLVVVLGLISEVYTIDVKIQALYRKKFNIARISGMISSQRANAARGGVRTRVQLLDFSDVARGGDVKFSNQRFPGMDPKEIQAKMTRGEIGIDFKGGFDRMFADKMRDVQRDKEGNVSLRPPGAPAKPGEALPQVNTFLDTYNKLPDDSARWKFFADNHQYFAANQMVDYGNVSKGLLPTNEDGSAVAPGQEAKQLNGQTVLPGQAFMTKADAEGLCDSYLGEIKAMEIEIDQELEILKAQRTALVQQREEFTKYASDAIKTGFKNNYA